MTALISIAVHIFGSIDLKYESVWLRSILAAASVAPMFLVIFLAQRTRISSVAFKSALVVCSYFFGGVVRGFVLTWTLYATGVLENMTELSRVSASSLSMSATIFIVTYTRTYFKNDSDAVASLNLENEQLIKALEKLESQQATQSTRHVSDVAKAIFDELDRIELRPAEEQLAKIETLIDEQVRPLSKKYALNIRDWYPEVTGIQKTSFLSAWQKLDPAMTLPPFWYALTVLALVPMPSAYASFGPRHAVGVAVLIFVSMAPSMFFGLRLLRRILPNVARPAREILFTLAMVIMAIPGVLGTVLALIDTPNPSAYVAGGLIMFPIYAWLLVIGRSFFDDLKRQQERLVEVRDKLQWARARVNLITWFNDGLISRLLHGPIQNSMHATALRLRNEGKSVVIENVIQELKSRVAQTLEQAEAGRTSVFDFQSSIRATQELWLGVAEVKIVADSAATEVLEQDRPLATIVVDLCNEICSNAIRHGKAKNLSFEIARNRDLIIVTAVDDATNQASEREGGLGRRFLDSCTTSWLLSRAASNNVLLAKLPCID